MKARGIEGEECMKRGRVEVNKVCRGHRGIDKGKDEKG